MQKYAKIMNRPTLSGAILIPMVQTVSQKKA